MPQSNYLKIRFLYLLYSRLTFLLLKNVLSPTKKGPYIGVTGFEPTASSSRTKRSTKLSHTPNNKIYFTTKIAFMQVKFLSFWFEINYAIIYFVATPIPAQRGGTYFSMDILITFIVSIMAGVVCHYICKWLDRNN